jgi:hypothetical protein
MDTGHVKNVWDPPFQNVWYININDYIQSCRGTDERRKLLGIIWKQTKTEPDIQWFPTIITTATHHHHYHYYHYTDEFLTLLYEHLNASQNFVCVCVCEWHAEYLC